MVKCKACGANVAQGRIRGKKCEVCDPAEGPQTVEVYVNELLSYVWHYYHTSSRVHLKRVVEEKFSHDDIKAAKKLLSDIGVVVEKADGRVTSTNRSALEADVADLMNALDNLDNDRELHPVFAAVDHSKISMTIPPEEACSSISLAVRMSKMEAMFAIIRSDVDKQTENVGTLFDLATERETCRKGCSIRRQCGSSTEEEPSTCLTGYIT